MANLENWFFKYNAWSYSKIRLFDLCKRSFYYRYIGTALRESGDVDDYRLKRLKDLNSKYALEGLLIHGVIGNQIGQHYIGRDLNEDGTKAQFVQRVEHATITHASKGQDIGMKVTQSVHAGDVVYRIG